MQEPAGSLHGLPDEDFWVNLVRPSVVQVPLIAFSDDEVIASPLVLDEDFWLNLVAPVTASQYQYLPYLPDAEEIPAGSLIPPIPPQPVVFSPIVLGPVLRSFEVSQNIPATVITSLNSLQLFQSPDSSIGLFLPAPGGNAYALFKRDYYIVAG